MKKLSLILLITLYSCSSFQGGQSYNYRATASLSSFTKSCVNLVSDLYNGTTKSQLTDILSRIADNGELSARDRKRLTQKVHEIPFLKDRVEIESKLKAGSDLTDREKKLVRNFIGRDIILSPNVAKHLYKKNYLAGDESLPLSYGLEFELTLKENPMIVNSYRVKNISEDKWFSLSLDERLSLAKEAQKNQNDIDHFLIRLSNANPKLPEGLFIEPHGTIEGNDMVFDNLGDFRELLTYFVEHFGGASFQSHVVMDSRSSLDGLAGYTLFEYDRAQLVGLERGYRRYLSNNSKTPGMNLIHHSLGPIDQDIANKVMKYEQNLAAGTDDFKTQGTKAVFAPNFRVNYPYGEGKMGFELRQFHNRDNSLFDAMVVLADDLEQYGSLDRFKGFDQSSHASMETLRSQLDDLGHSSDDIDDVELFLLSLGEEIVKSIKSVGGARGGASLDNRLLLPLRDWKNHPILESIDGDVRDGILKDIHSEQAKFAKQVLELAREYDITEVNEEALKKVQVLIGRWAQDTNLSWTFENYLKSSKGIKKKSNYNYLPELSFFKKEDNYIATKSERSIPVYKFKRGSSSEESAYSNYLENTFEVGFRDIGDTGHIELRVGKTRYSIDNYMLGSSMTSTESFTGFKSGATGRVYRLNRAQIKELNEKVAAYIKSVGDKNFPPFDVWGGVEEVAEVSGGFKIVGKSKNKGKIRASLVEQDGKKFFKNGEVLIPAIEKDGKLHIQTTNCTQGVVDILRDYLDINLGNYPSANMLHSAFNNDSVRVPYEAIIEY